jgi:hypothetical protein
MRALWDEIAGWSRATFGADDERGPLGSLKHLKKEADEAIDRPQDVLEFADCLILVFDAARRAGFSLDILEHAALYKMALNRQRHYPKPVGDEVSEHLR